MASTQFSGQLHANEIFSGIYNMIISQFVNTRNVADNFTQLVDRAKVDGSLYGDTKLFYDTDALETSAWTGDAEASNLLALHRPDDPKCQAIILDQFRIVALTVDNYLSKRAWAEEGAFSQFQSVMLGWMRDTKRIYETTLFNTYIGTKVTEATRNTVDIDLSSASPGDPLYGLTGNEAAEMEGKLIAQAIADLIVDMKDVSRDFNDYQHLKSYSEDDLTFVFSSKWANKVRKVDLPTIFHNEGLVDKLGENILPARYFGSIVTVASATADTTRFTVSTNTATVNAGVTDVRSLIETTYTVSTVEYHLFPGDVIPVGASFDASTPVAYVEDPDIICKVMVGNAVPLMSAFEVGTNFYNPRSLTENHYLIWGYNTLSNLYHLPLITVEKG